MALAHWVRPGPVQISNLHQSGDAPSRPQQVALEACSPSGFAPTRGKASRATLLVDISNRTPWDFPGWSFLPYQFTARRAYSAKGEDLPVEVLEGSLPPHLPEFKTYRGGGITSPS